MSENVARLIGLANTQGVPTLSMDDDAPPELLETASAWFATAIMEWREW